MQRKKKRKKDVYLHIPLIQPGVTRFCETSAERETTLHLYIKFTRFQSDNKSSLPLLIRNRSTATLRSWIDPDIPANLPKEAYSFPLQGGESRLSSYTDTPGNPTPLEADFSGTFMDPLGYRSPTPCSSGLSCFWSDHSPTVSECATWIGRQQRRVPVLHWKATMGTSEPPGEEEWQAAPEATQPPPSSQPWSAYRKHFTFFRFVPPSSGSALGAG